jgi:hypothetical protein
MSRHEWLSEGWFYKQSGETCGPVSAERLKELLAVGLLRPRQAVWQRSGHDMLFIAAATAASGAAGDGPPPGSQAASA